MLSTGRRLAFLATFPSHRQAVRLQDVIHARDPQPHSQGGSRVLSARPAHGSCPRRAHPIKREINSAVGQGVDLPLNRGRVLLSTGRRLAFPTTFPFARTSLMKPARKLRPSGIRRRHGAMDDTTIQQEAAQRRPGRGQERRRASPPSRGRRSIDRTAAKATSGEGEGKGWERPGGNRMPRGTTRQAEANRAATCARVSGKGRGREDKTSTSEQIGECRPTPYVGTDSFSREYQDVGPVWSSK